MIARRLALVGAASFATMAALRVCDPLLPRLAGEFGIGTGRAGHAVSAFAAAYGIALLGYGPLADRCGKFAVVAFATLGCAVAALACALAPSFDTLVAARALSGAAAAGVTPPAMAWIGDSVPYERRQAVLARLIGATTLGMIAGQTLGGVLADTLGWRSAFVLLAGLFAGTGALMGAELRRGGDAGAQRQAQGIAVARPPSSIGALRQVLLMPWPRRVLLFAFVEGLFVFAGLAFLPSHLHARFGLPMGAAGGVVVLYAAGGLLYSRHASTLLRRVGEAGLARAGGTLLCAYFAALVVLPSWPWALAACLAGGLGFYMLHNTLQTHATQMAPAVRATAVTTFSAALFLGHSLGVAGAAIVVDRHSAIPVFAVSALALPVLAWRFAAAVQRRQARMLSRP
jgi:predicted MFS family arabinose efflux permease